MAINNTLNPGLLATPSSQQSTQAPLSQGTLSMANPNAGWQNNVSSNPQGVSGLVSPQHPTAPVTSSTITTNPDMSTTHKQTYDPNLFMLPGETPAQYSARVSTYQASQNNGSSGTSSGSSTQSSGAPTPPPPQFQPNQGLFGNVASSLANTSAASSPVSSQAQQGLISTAKTDPLTSGAAYDTYNQAVQNLSTLKQQIAAKYGGTESQPIPLEFQQGQEQVLARQYASQLDAAQQAVTQAQAALGYGIQEQGQQQAGYNQAGGLANAQQGLVQSGLASAGSLTQPSGNFPFVFNPSTGTFTNAGGGVMTPSEIAQAISSGKMSPTQGLQAGSYLGASAQSQIASAMQGVNPNYNWNTGAASAAATAANTQAVGTAPTNAQLGVYQTQLQNLGASQVAASQIAAFGNQLITTMSQSPANGGLGINPSSSQYANEKINQIKTQFNDPQYATFNTNIAGLQARVASLLQTGEIPTAATAGAQDIVNGNATLAAMQATLTQIGQEAGAITGSQAQVASTAYQQAQQSATGTNAPISVGQYTFVKNAQGQWVSQ